jgi:DUF2911 family protein
MPSRRTIWTTLGLGAILAGTCAVTGVSYVPVSLALGPCLKDWTSPTTYAPRSSPFASEDFKVGSASVRLCYGRPSARGRTVYGQLVPWDTVWRMGANEPTRLYTDRPIHIGSVRVEPGRYSLYAAPGTTSWTIYVNRDILHWGNDLSPAVRATEIGSTLVEASSLAEPVETLTIRPDSPTSATGLVVTWERTRVTIPLAAP